MKYNPLSRRMFLQGLAAGGGYVGFGIPLLPSLVPRRAEAQAMTVPPRFMAFSSQNGGIATPDWYPASGLPMGNERVPFFYPRHTRRYLVTMRPNIVFMRPTSISLWRTAYRIISTRSLIASHQK